jgi:3-oxoacyl-[acyl-carrier-protein] synthase II
MDLYQQYAFAAAAEAIADSSLEIEPLRTGVVMGSALAGIQHTADTQRELSVDVSRSGRDFLPR